MIATLETKCLITAVVVNSPSPLYAIGQKQLVGEMRPDGCRNALLAEPREHLSLVLVINRYGEGVASGNSIDIRISIRN